MCQRGGGKAPGAAAGGGRTTEHGAAVEHGDDRVRLSGTADRQHRGVGDVVCLAEPGVRENAADNRCGGRRLIYRQADRRRNGRVATRVGHVCGHGVAAVGQVGVRQVT